MVRSQGKGCIKPQVKIFENLPASVTDVQETKVDRTYLLVVSPALMDNLTTGHPSVSCGVCVTLRGPQIGFVWTLEDEIKMI